MRRFLARSLLLVIVAACWLPGCDEQSPTTASSAEAEIAFHHHELAGMAHRLGATAGPISWELRFSVEDEEGHELAHEVLNTELYSYETQVVLPCASGQRNNSAHVQLVAAYEGRPRSPRGGVGGIVLPDSGYRTARRFECPTDGAKASVRLPGTTTPSIQSSPSATVSFYISPNVVLPEWLANRQVFIGWEERSAWGAGESLVYSSMVFAQAQNDDGEAVAVEQWCWTELDNEVYTVRLRPLLVVVDGDTLPRETWRLDDAVFAVDCGTVQGATLRTDLVLTVDEEENLQ